MNNSDFNILKLYLSSFFLDFINLPSAESVFIIINNYLSDCDFPSYGIAGLLDILNSVIDNEMNLRILSHHYTLGDFLLDYPEFDPYEDDKCLLFFKKFLKEELVPLPQKIESLANHCMNIVQYNECHENRVVDVIRLFKRIRTFAEKKDSLFPSSSCDKKSCECIEFEKSGDCHHLDDECS